MKKASIILFLFIVQIYSLTIAIQPFGTVPSSYTGQMETALENSFADVTVVVLPSKPLPKRAYYKPRNRYRAEKLLDWIDQQNYDSSIRKVIGITEKDISTTKGDVYDWGIFGLGTIDGLSSVISTFRLKKGVSQEKLLDRIRKLAIHEVGHTYGLNHCETLNCVMQDCKGSIKPVDQESGAFCKKCLKKLNQ